MSRVGHSCILAVAVVAMVACSSRRTAGPEPASRSGAVGAVVVELAESIRTDKRTRFDAKMGQHARGRPSRRHCRRRGSSTQRAPAC